MELLMAGLFAAALAFVELKQALKRQRIPMAACHWVVARMGVDGILAVGIYPVMAAATNAASWPATLFPVLLAGFAAPAALRSSVVVGREGKRLGVGDRYQKWLKVVTDEISDISSAGQSKWLWNRVIPRLEVFGLESLKNRSVTYLHARQQAGQLTGKQVADHESYIDRIIQDPKATEDAKRAALMQALIDRGGRRFVAGLARSARQEKRRMNRQAKRTRSASPS